MPAMVLMGAGFLALSVTHDLDSVVLWFGMFAAVLGVGNGLSSGILLTLGAIAPLLVSGITAVVSLSFAAGAMGLIGLVGAAGFLRWIPRFVPRTPPPTPDPADG
jgi:hypothetical protein